MATQEQVNKAVKEHVGDLVSGLREELRHTEKSEREHKHHGKHEHEQRPVADPDAGKFKVTGPGYSEQFTSKKAGLVSFDSLKKRLLKNEQAATVRLLTQGAGSLKWEVVQELKLNEDHY
jgi:hypothetical protein